MTTVLKVRFYGVNGKITRRFMVICLRNLIFLLFSPQVVLIYLSKFIKWIVRRDSHQQLTSTLGVHVTICDSDCTLGPEIRKHCSDLTFHFLQQCFDVLVFLSRGTENRLS